MRGTFLINGAIVLNGFAITLAWPSRKKRLAEAMVERNAETITTNGQTNLTQFKTSVFRTLRINSIVSITGNAPFILFAIGNALCQTALTVFTVYTVDVVTDQGGSQASGSFGLFLFSITSTIGRIVPGIMKQIPDVSVVTASLLSSVLSFASTLLIVLVPSFTLTLVCICCAGLAFGVQAANISIATAKLIDDILMPTGMGLIFTIIGLGAVTYGPFMVRLFLFLARLFEKLGGLCCHLGFGVGVCDGVSVGVFPVKPFNARPFLKHCVCCCFETSHTY